MTEKKLDLPDAFESQMRSMLSGHYENFHASLLAPSPVSIRLNMAKNAPHRDASVVPWCPSGRYLTERPSFTLDPHFHAGAYYVQEASSMFLEQALHQSIDLSESLRVLDLCAAPGGKSTHLLSLLSSGSLLVSNEAIGSRVTVLSENLQKWGYANVIVTNNDPSAFSRLTGFFDVILVDAPCSGEGLFRKDPAATSEWSTDSVAICAARQRRIVQDVWPALKTNGLMIYCTCTFNEIENEDNLKWLRSKAFFDSVPLTLADKGIEEVRTGGITAYRFFPHKVQGEGFFLSVMRKLDTVSDAVRRKLQNDQARKASSKIPLKGDYVTLSNGNLSIAVPQPLSDNVQWLSEQLNVILRGTAIGTYKREKYIPDHATALSVALDHTAFPFINLTYEEAIRYLRKDTLHLNTSQKGYTLARYEGNTLGWMNVLDNRINNLYPSSWRIRMQ